LRPGDYTATEKQAFFATFGGKRLDGKNAPTFLNHPVLV
jgi:hypothetical protein